MPIYYQEYRLWIVALFGGLSVFILATIWHFYYYKRRRPNEAPDFGLLFLCAGLLVWVIAAIIGLSFIAANARISDSVRHVFSMINNGLITCSFPFFEYSIISDSSSRTRRYWTAITLSITTIVLIAAIICTETGNKQSGNLLDFLSTCIVLIVLTGILFKTFDKRRLKALGYFSILVTVCMLLSQFLITFRDAPFLQAGDFFLIKLGFVMGGISFTLFILILVVLAFTWVLEHNNVFDEWKDEEAIQQALKHPENAIKYLKRLTKDGASLYDMPALKFFINCLPDKLKQKPEFDEINNQFIHLAGRLRDLNTSNNKATLPLGYYNKESNRIREAMIAIIKELESLLYSSVTS